MQRFMIEREIPGASELTDAELVRISPTSNAAVRTLGVPYTWATSNVAAVPASVVSQRQRGELL